MSGEELTQALRDAGCNEAAATELMKLYTEGQTTKAQKLLSQHRKELLDAIHAEERQISCLDYLEYTLRKGEQA